MLAVKEADYSLFATGQLLCKPQIVIL